MLAIRQAFKELMAEKRFALLFLLNLSLGLSGLVSMEAFRASLTASLAENAQALLGADLALSGRRALNEGEKKALGELSARAEARTELVETFSMVRTPKATRLVLLKGLGERYPLRGYLQLERRGRVEAGSAGALLSDHRAWMEADLARQLGLTRGDRFQVGSVTLTLDDFVKEDPTQGFRGLAQSGRIFFAASALRESGLLRTESTATYTELFRFAGAPDLEKEAELWGKRFPDPALRVRAAGDAADDSGRLLGYLGDFLGLSALVALFLSSLGSAYLFRTWLLRRSRTFALHQVLGLSFRQAVNIPALQALLLAFASVPLALALGAAELEALAWLVRSLAPVELAPRLTLASALVGLAVAGIGSFALSMPFLWSLRSLSPKDLLGGKIPEPRFSPSALLLFAPAALLLYGLAVYESRSYRTAAIFFGSLSGALFVFLICGLGFLWALGMAAGRLRSAPWPLRQGLLHLSRRGFTTLSAFIALALGALLLNLLPQLRSSLSAELENPAGGKLPSFFLFDIQEEQLAPLQAELKAKGLELQNVSPLVRARLLAVNSQAFERSAGPEGYRTREEEMEARFRNRGFNLSYRPGLTSAETLTAGRAFANSGSPEISVEERFAERLKLRLGDKLHFDVQGVEVEGTVVNFRKVRWTTFQPNFFVIFSEGVLEGAPKIYLGSLPELPPDEREAVQNLVGEKFPNISAVDVRATVNRGLELADRMRWCLNLMSFISLFAGMVVLFSIAYRQAELRRWDMNLVKILGARSTSIRAQTLWEFGLLASTAAAFGASLSLAFSWVCARYFFEGAFVPAWTPLAISVLGCTLLALLVAALGARGVWQRNPSELLQEQAL